MKTMLDLEGLRLAARVYHKLCDWLDNEAAPIARDRVLWRGARIISGLERELWAVRVWAAREAALYVARQVSDHNHDHIAAALCWLAAHGSEGDWDAPGTGATRCVPAEYLDAVYAYAYTATEAAATPRFSSTPLYNRLARGGQVWDEAFLSASREWEEYGILETGLETLAGLTREGTSVYRECARTGRLIMLARKMRSIAEQAMEEEGVDSCEEYSHERWHAVPGDGGYTRKVAAAEAAHRTNAAPRIMCGARAAARAALGLPPEQSSEALDSSDATDDPAPAAEPAS